MAGQISPYCIVQFLGRSSPCILPKNTLSICCCIHPAKYKGTRGNEYLRAYSIIFNLLNEKPNSFLISHKESKATIILTISCKITTSTHVNPNHTNPINSDGISNRISVMLQKKKFVLLKIQKTVCCKSVDT